MGENDVPREWSSNSQTTQIDMYCNPKTSGRYLCIFGTCQLTFVGGAVDMKTRIFLNALPIGTARFCAFFTTYVSVSRGRGGVGWG